MPQGLLPFQYQADSTPLTAFAGLPLYLDLIQALDLRRLLNTLVNARSGGQGYSDAEACIALLLLNLAGGSCVEDLERLEADAGLRMALKNAELHGLRGKAKRAALKRFRSPRHRAMLSPSSCHRYLEAFHDSSYKGVPGSAVIPKPSAALKGLYAVNAAVMAFQQRHHPQATATLDVDVGFTEILCERDGDRRRGHPVCGRRGRDLRV